MEDEQKDDIPCAVCDQDNNHEMMLLCDDCDAHYHCGCLDPPLDAVPPGSWSCPDCKPTTKSKRVCPLLSVVVFFLCMAALLPKTVLNHSCTLLSVVGCEKQRGKLAIRGAMSTRVHPVSTTGASPTNYEVRGV